MSKTFDRYSSIVFLLVGLLFVIESQKISDSAYGSISWTENFPNVAWCYFNSIKLASIIRNI